MTSTHFPLPPTADLRRLLDAELSLRSRLGYVGLLLSSAAMTAVILSLWLTEPTLPVRTAVAFAVLTVIGLAWVVFAGWVLTRRRPLFGRDRLVAGWMAVTFTSAFAVGTLAVGYLSGGAAPYAASAMALVLLAVAVAALVRARRNIARLTARREALERELGINEQ